MVTDAVHGYFTMLLIDLDLFNFHTFYQNRCVHRFLAGNFTFLLICWPDHVKSLASREQARTK